jgi:hypothetical protein
MGVGGHCHTLAACSGKDLVLIVREAGWAAEPAWMGLENLAPTSIQSPDHPACSQSLY